MLRHLFLLFCVNISLFASSGSILAEKFFGEKAATDDSGTASAAIKKLYEVQSKYVEAGMSTGNADLPLDQAGGLMLSFFTLFIPILRVAGVILIIWSIKWLFLDEPQKHGGTASAIIGGVMRFVVGVILINSDRIFKMFANGIGSASRVDVMAFLLDTFFMITFIMGLIMVILGVFHLTKQGRAGDGTITRAILWGIGGLLFMNISNIVLYLVG